MSHMPLNINQYKLCTFIRATAVGSTYGNHSTVKYPPLP